MLRIRNTGAEGETNSEELIRKSDVSVSVETRASISVLCYVTKALVTAEFKEMSNDEFKKRYLGPFDEALRLSNLDVHILSRKYSYPLGDAMHMEHDIQRYFDGKIAPGIDELYRDLGGEHHYFDNPSVIRPPFDRSKKIIPDIVHLAGNVSTPNFQYPEVCYGIGEYKKGNYYLAEGFEKLKDAIAEYKERIQNRRNLRLQSGHNLFQNREWTSRVICALVVRKYLYQALLCGTNRVFISDHQSFSIFLEYNFSDDEQMSIDYYIINDPETVSHGITLRSAMVGFFYNGDTEARITRERLRKSFRIGEQMKGSDPFANIVPRPVDERTGKRKGIMLSEDELLGRLEMIEESADIDDYGEIHGNTYCRIIYDAPKWYPGLRLRLPINVFVKMYNYPDLIFENFPEKDSYYNMYLNELEINILLKNSQFAASFPRLLVSGYWNGVYSQPMHIFEYLGEEKSMDEWDYDKVYEVIKQRLEDIHQLGITHNDVRLANIHVSLSGKISLIDFGLSVCPSSEELRQEDFTALDHIFSKNNYNDEENKQTAKNYRNVREDDIPSSARSTNESSSKCNDDTNSLDDIVFDRISEQSQETESTKKDLISK